MLNMREIKPVEDTAIDVVTSIVNKAHDRMGVHQTLYQIARSRNVVGREPILCLISLQQPLALNGEKFIRDAIEKTWRLTSALHYHLRYLQGSQDETSQYFYFEGIFSQPTAAFPIPQASVSVYFRIEDRHTEPPDVTISPKMVFRVEGHHTEHDVHNVKLTVDMILAVLAMKIKIFDRIEFIRMF